MSEPLTFPLFSLLPKEIRLEIWTHAIQPRIITFECELYCFNPRLAPQKLYLVGGDPPFTRFEIDVPQRPNSPYYLAQSYPPNLGASPPVLSTCQESRDLALRCGYRRWTIQNQLLGTRDLMWNPKCDVISLGMSPITDDPCLEVFIDQFPEQVKEIERLAVWRSFWPPGHISDTTPWRTLFEFKNLIALALVIDSELKIAKDIGDRLAQATSGLETALTKAKQQSMLEARPESDKYVELESWHLPKIRILADEEEFLSKP